MSEDEVGTSSIIPQGLSSPSRLPRQTVESSNGSSSPSKNRSGTGTLEDFDQTTLGMSQLYVSEVSYYTLLHVCMNN